LLIIKRLFLFVDLAVMVTLAEIKRINPLMGWMVGPFRYSLRNLALP